MVIVFVRRRPPTAWMLPGFVNGCGRIGGRLQNLAFVGRSSNKLLSISEVERCVGERLRLPVHAESFAATGAGAGGCRRAQVESERGRSRQALGHPSR